MDHDEVEGNLPWLLNGTLADAERVEVEAHLASCDACRAALRETRLALLVHAQHTPVDSILDLASGQPLPPDELDKLESTIARDAELQDELRLSRTGLAEIRRVEAESAQVPRRVGWLPIAAMIAGAALLGGAGSWLGLRPTLLAERSAHTEAAQRVDELAQRLQTTEAELRELSRRTAETTRAEANVPVVALLPAGEALRGSGGTVVVDVGPTTRSVTLLLFASVVRQQQVNAAWIDAHGRSTWTVAGLRKQPTDEFTLSVPAALLLPGKARIDLLDPDRPDGRPVATYQVEIRSER